jgi:mannose-6-phosphate isomerase
MNVPDSFAVYIVTKGEGVISGEGYERGIRRGDYFFMPHCAMGAFSVSGSAEIVECY